MRTTFAVRQATLAKVCKGSLGEARSAVGEYGVMDKKTEMLIVLGLQSMIKDLSNAKDISKQVDKIGEELDQLIELAKKSNKSDK